MQPSQLEIQREVEALRDIRRRSTIQGGPGSLILDPDLPNEASQSQPAYWSPTDDSSSSSHDSHADHSSVPAQDDPFHLFWVPARVHPELAPKEFRDFLKEHARTSPDGTANSPERSNSVSSIGLGRKRSMLSRQYKPSANDGVGDGDEKVVPLRRNRSSYAYVPQLTISDLQKLEELAEEASTSDDPSKLRSVLRRSLSLNIAPSVIDQVDDLRDLGDDVDSPIIVPLPGQVLKRTARTKIRKTGTGEGAHRFTATRSRRQSIGRAATAEPRTSSDLSSSDHGEAETIRRVARSITTTDVPEVPPLPRPESYSLEAAIYEAYAQEESEREPVSEPSALSKSPDIITELVSGEPVAEDVEPQPEIEPESSPVPAGPILHHPQPQRALAPPSSTASPNTQRTPSPSTPSPDPSPPSNSSSLHLARPSLQGGSPYHPPSPSPSEHRRDKDKRGLFGKWGGGDKSGKKQKDKGNEREKEKDTSFFGSLFGSKKKPEELLSSNAAGREAAAALLGASKSSKNYVPPPSPQLGMYARYPIHVERAIYRLSHIKLANPRRPLYEQVLISNLMFWYLGVINKTGQNQGGQGQNAGASGQQAGSVVTSPADKERAERERKEQAERAERERVEREKQEKKEGQRRGSLTKPAPIGSPSRRAETPVRGPQYEMQHRAMEQGYGGYGQPNGGPPAMRTSSAAPPLMNSPLHRSPSPQPSQFSVQLVQSQPRNANSLGSTNNQYHEIGELSQLMSQQFPLLVTGTPQLPPGAMPPVAVDQTWISQSGMPMNSTSPPPRQGSPPTPQSSPGSRRPRSPPQANRYSPQPRPQDVSGSGKAPSRSLSATATPSQPMALMNGKVKKVMSAHATPPRQTSEDEDVPLAVWQQQRRKEL